jgi:phosphopentomutase
MDFGTHEQVPSRAKAAGHEVVLLGKAADVVHCEGAVTDNVIPTEGVMRKTIDHLAAMGHGLIVSNVQETDLSGHEEDVERYGEVLELVDRMLPELLDGLHDDDVILITGDHGNDPTIGHSQHTREYTPVLAFGPRVATSEVGLRETLADVGATAADLLGVLPLRAGRSFAKELQPRCAGTRASSRSLATCTARGASRPTATSSISTRSPPTRGRSPRPPRRRGWRASR